MAKIKTKAQARKQALKDFARSHTKGGTFKTSAGVDKSADTATVEELRAYYEAHSGLRDVSDDLIDQVIIGHANKNGLCVSESDLCLPANIGKARYTSATAPHPHSPAPQASQASEQVMADADEALASVSESTPDTPSETKEPSLDDRARDFLKDMVGGIGAGPDGWAKAQTAIRDLLEQSQISVRTNAAPIEPDASIGRTGSARICDQIADIKENKSTRHELAVYNDAKEHKSDYIWPAHAGLALAAIARQTPVFLTGPAGTGKTTFARELALAFGRPFKRISCHDQTEGPTLTGMIAPDIKDGVKWRDGALAAALRIPGAVVLVDEPSVARPGALMVLQALLDDERALVIEETGERLAIADDVILICADNTNGAGDITGNYAGTRQLNAAFMDRFGVVLPIGYLPKDKETKVVQGLAGADKKTAAAVVAYADATRQAATKGELTQPVSTRGCARLAALLSDGAAHDAAFTLAIGSRASVEDAEPLRLLFQTHFASVSDDLIS
jgi:cobaltochelatase CobS